ncbi:MAG: hypothetical protein WBW73_00645 [Rhodoplanes sp.]
MLDKADGETDAKYRSVVKAKWDEWKADKYANAIFWNFVEAERNNLLKQYKFGVEPEPTYIVIILRREMGSSPKKATRLSPKMISSACRTWDVKTRKDATSSLKPLSGGGSNLTRLKRRYRSDRVQTNHQPGDDVGVGAVMTRRFPAPWGVRELEQAFVWSVRRDPHTGTAAHAV